jgi:hypothetical protein
MDLTLLTTLNDLHTYASYALWFPVVAIIVLLAVFK